MKRTILIAFLAAAAGPAQANDPVVGVWQAPPDAKGQVGHIRVAPCNSGFCGTIIRAFSPDGKEIVTPNVGKRVLWGMRAQGGGEYDEGRIYVPAHGREYKAQMTVNGSRLTIRGCVGPVCQKQVMQRVR